jgi:Fic family protein
MGTYIWQLASWPEFRWDSEALLVQLGTVRRAQGRLLAVARELGLELELEALSGEAVATSLVEGERLSEELVRSSVARRLGIPTAGLPEPGPRVDALVEVLWDATRNHQAPVTKRRLCAWQAALFPTGYSGLTRVSVGKWRSADRPMQVVSGPLGREKVHFEAPPAERVAPEMEQLLAWLRRPPAELDGLIAAALAQFWFVTIHPFEDGNGRVGRALSDLLLARDEGSGVRLYSMSAQIMAERQAYYQHLETAQRGDGDLTSWLAWFLGCLQRAMEHSWQQVEAAQARARFWKQPACDALNPRQRKVLERLLEAGLGGFEGGLNNRKYRALTKVSPEIAKRDLAHLLTLGLLMRNPGGGRSASYSLVSPQD